MTTPLALLNLLHQKTRTLVAIAGVSFAIILIFMQLGFRGCAEATATVLYDRLDDFEIVLVSSEYRDMNRAGAFPRTRLYEAMSVPGVAHAYPLYMGFQLWRNPISGIMRSIFVVGFVPTDPVFRGFPELRDDLMLQDLSRRDTVLIDRQSHPDFGVREATKPDGTSESEIGWNRVEVVGQFSMGTGFAADGSVITSARTFSKLQRGRSLDLVSLGLVRLKPGTDVKAVQKALRAALPADVNVWTKNELEGQEKSYWLNGKSIGILFTCGVAVAFLVGVIFVYQIISSDIANHLSEYATLKAMGYGERYLSSVVLQQAVLLGVASYLPAIAVSLCLYEVTRVYARVPIDMSMGRATGVFVMAILMCSLSGFFSLQKVRSADPADLF